LVKKPGDDVQILSQIAQAYYKAANYMVAHQLFYKMFENDNKNVKALYMAGVALIKAG
jgi:cytochrome c-type biogenesis protein CcmH/NrfG